MRDFLKERSKGSIALQVGSKSVLNLPAQYVTLCCQDTEQSLSEVALKTITTKYQSSRHYMYVIGVLIFRYGLRVSEVLNIRYSDVRVGHKLFIHGAKKSNNRLLDIYELNDFFCLDRSNTSYIFTGISRFFIYREFKKLGIGISIEGNKKLAVTHAGRHLLMQELKNSGDSTDDLQRYIGHKSINSTKCYTQEKI